MARVLVVDDEKSIRNTMSEFLRIDGHEVWTAEDADAAGALMQAHSFDVVVTDIILPRVSGVTLLQRIKEQAPDVQVILMTGEPTVDTAVEAVRAGAYEYLSKPTGKGELLAAVGQAARVKALLDEKHRLEADNRRYREGLELMVGERTEALATRTRQLEAVRAVSVDITRELDLATLLGLIFRRVGELIGTGACTVWLWDESAQVLVPQVWNSGDAWRGEVRLRLGEGVGGAVAQRREGLLLNDYRTSAYAAPVFLDRTTVTAVMGEPLLYHDRLLGAITIDNADLGRPFTDQDREVLSLLVTHAAIAIENARLYATIRAHAAELEIRVRQRTRDLELANQQLEEASRRKSEFLASMSHELRTPLNSILGFGQLLLEQTGETLSPKQTRFLTHIFNSGQHLLQLINDILDLSKVEAGKFVLQPERLPVAETVGDILVIARGLANKKGQTIRPEIARDLPWLYADPVRFKQILFNLLSNAVKFTPERGTITVTACRICDSRFPISDFPNQDSEPQSQIANRKSEMLELAVTDTGIGIKAEDLPRLFQEFVQLKGAKSQEGTGLGLALTKRLVEMHGGRIRAESPGEGCGSTFTILLPFSGPGETQGH